MYWLHELISLTHRGHFAIKLFPYFAPNIILPLVLSMYFQILWFWLNWIYFLNVDSLFHALISYFYLFHFWVGFRLQWLFNNNFCFLFWVRELNFALFQLIDGWIQFSSCIGQFMIQDIWSLYSFPLSNSRSSYIKSTLHCFFI